MEFDWCLCLIGLVAREGIGADAKLDSSGNITDTRQDGKYNLNEKVTVYDGDLDVGERSDNSDR